MFVILSLAALVGCKTTAPVKSARVTPPRPPVIERHVEPITAAVPSQLKQPNFNDPIDVVILQAQLRFDSGEAHYKQGAPKRAKEEFNSAIDLLLESAATYPRELRLQRQLMDLTARVNAIELAALREGDGFTDQAEQPAAIDDLVHVETFPALIDPALKKTVEDEVKEITHDLPIEINDRVLGLLDYYQNGRGRGAIEFGLERMGKYQPMIERILKEEGVPLDLIYLCQAESAFEPRALSRASAKGMWQFISSRGKEYGLRQTWWIDERSDPEKSTRAAARHLKDLYQEFGDWYLAMAAYNSGPVRVQRAMEKTGADNFWSLADKRALPRETINYVPNILALTIIGKNPSKYGFSVSSISPTETERVSVEKATDLRVIAEAIDLPVEDLRALNTHVLRWTTPPDDPDFQLVLPKGYAEKFNEQISSLPESKRILYKDHVIRKGDTLAGIARTYGMTVTQLSQANNLGKKPVLRVGQSLVIPLSGVTPPRIGAGSKPATTTSSASAGTKVAATKPSAPATTQPGTVKSVFYTVRPGDTLVKIATRFNTTVEKLKAWNHLTSTQLSVGKRLLVSSPTTQAKADAGPAKVVHEVADKH